MNRESLRHQSAIAPATDHEAGYIKPCGKVPHIIGHEFYFCWQVATGQPYSRIVKNDHRKVNCQCIDKGWVPVIHRTPKAVAQNDNVTLSRDAVRQFPAVRFKVLCAGCCCSGTSAHGDVI